MKTNRLVFFVFLTIFIIFFVFGSLTSCKQTKQVGHQQSDAINQTNANNQTKTNQLNQNQSSSEQDSQDIPVLYRCDLLRSGVFKGENPKIKGEVIWKFELKEENPINVKQYDIGRVSPIIFEDILFIGNVDNNIYAIDVKTGKQLWKFSTDGLISSSPALWNRTLFIGNNNGFFYALNIDTQKLIWKHKTNGSIVSSPAIAERMVFFGSTDGTFYALDALTGKEKWKWNSEQSITCDPAILDDRIYIAANPKESSEDSKEQQHTLPRIIALDVKTGEMIWQVETNEGYLDNLCLVKREQETDTLYVGFSTSITPPDEYQNTVFSSGVLSVDISFDTHQTSRLLSYYPSHGFSVPYLSCNGSALCFVGDTEIYAVNIGGTRKNGERYQDYITHGEYMWNFKVKTYSRSEFSNMLIGMPPMFNGDGNMIYFGDGNGYLHIIETNTGKEIFEMNIGSLEEKDPSNLINSYIVDFPLLYKNKLYIYVCKRYNDSGEIRNSKQIGMLYCLE